MIFAANGAKKVQIEGADADEVWRRLHDDAAKANPKFFGSEIAPLQQAVSASGLGEAILSVFRATNLLSPFEKVRLQDLLRGPNADEFVRAAARFTLGAGKPALLQVQRALKPHDSAKWTVATYLPFLWRPEEHMFLKPEVTKDLVIVYLTNPHCGPTLTPG